VAGQFELVQILASGAFGTVCVVRDLRAPGAPLVALKVLRSEYSSNHDIMQRVRDEARMLTRLRHPNIVRVHTMMEFAGNPAVVMEWVEGSGTDRLLQREGLRDGLPFAVAAQITRRAASALDAAYYSPSGPGGRPMHIVHRDIKPSNMLLSVAGEVKVVDFGQAKGEFIDREAVSAVHVLGTRGYTAPERMDGAPAAPSVDVYALGLSLYELLAGRKLVASLRQDRHDAAVERALDALVPHGLGPEWAPRLRVLMARMCSYDADKRPLPGHVARDLGWIIEGSGAQVDLAPFAAEHVAPLLQERLAAPKPAEWKALEALVEQSPSVRQLDVPSVDVAEPEARIRELMSRAGWSESTSELRTLLARMPPSWSPEPLLAVLDRATPRWWKVWERPATNDELRVALDLLRSRALGPTDVERVRGLATHTDAGVARLARQLMARGDARV
jgi:serine/threonine protein kinase